MATISSTTYKSVYTTLMAARYDEMLEVKTTGFLQSMFVDNVTKHRNPAYDVRRGSEKVAVDVIRGHQGKRIQLTKATQKITDPFFYKMFFDATEMDSYWNVFGSSSISENVMVNFVDEAMLRYRSMEDMVDRAKELHCAEVFEFGTCTSLSDGSVINFNRKAGSMVDKGAGNYWVTDTIDPYADIATGCEWIRKNGKYSGGVFNIIMGATAFQHFLNNAIVKGRNDLKMWKLDDLVAPEQKVDGNTYHGTISAGPYTVHIWQYPQFYENTGGTLTPYINPKKVVLTPANTKGAQKQSFFQMIYGAIPQVQVPGKNTSTLIAAKALMTDYANPEKGYHNFYYQSSPLAVPLAIDTIYTLQAVA